MLRHDAQTKLHIADWSQLVHRVTFLGPSCRQAIPIPTGWCYKQPWLRTTNHLFQNRNLNRRANFNWINHNSHQRINEKIPSFSLKPNCWRLYKSGSQMESRTQHSQRRVCFALVSKMESQQSGCQQSEILRLRIREMHPSSCAYNRHQLRLLIGSAGAFRRCSFITAGQWDRTGISSFRFQKPDWHELRLWF